LRDELYLHNNTTKTELKQAWGDFLTDLGDKAGGWDWWFTGTFRDIPEDTQHSTGWAKPGWGYTGKAWDKLQGEITARIGLQTQYWVRGREYQQWRGVPHFHALIGGVGDLRRDEVWSWWYERYGQARIEPYNHELGAGYYLCKYVTKELGDIQFSKGLSLK
jgi:hypothetical protein